MIISLFNEYWLHVGFFLGLDHCLLVVKRWPGKEKWLPVAGLLFCSSVSYHGVFRNALADPNQYSANPMDGTAGMEWLHVGLDRASGVCFRAASDLL